MMDRQCMQRQSEAGLAMLGRTVDGAGRGEGLPGEPRLGGEWFGMAKQSRLGRAWHGPAMLVSTRYGSAKQAGHVPER